MIGIVKKVVPEKSFGFIKSEASGVEYFFHASGFNGDWGKLERDVNNGKEIKVEFDTVANNKGPRAENVNIIVREGQKHEY